MAKQLITLKLSRPLQSSFPRVSRLYVLLAFAASMTLFSSPRAAAQNPSDSTQKPQADSQEPPPPAQSDQRRVISRDPISQGTQNPQGPNQEPPRRPRHGNGTRPVAQPSGPVPASLTIPAGKVIFARLNEPLSSDHNHAGDTFTATLDHPIVVDGWVVARRGETIIGTVTEAQKAGRVKGVSRLGLELTDVTVADGNQMPVEAELWKGSAGTSHGADAAAIATTTGVGTIIGAAANGGTGAGVGAGAGALAGIGLVLLTRGKPTVLGPEYPLSFRLKEPLTVSTENSAQAFQPVGSDDYNSSPSPRHRGGPAYPAYPVAYPPYYAACGPYWGCGPYYPYPYYGYYGPVIGFSYWGGYGHGYGHGFGRGGFRR
jgi:hypothetical protein